MRAELRHGALRVDAPDEVTVQDGGVEHDAAFGHEGGGPRDTSDNALRQHEDIRELGSGVGDGEVVAVKRHALGVLLHQDRRCVVEGVEDLFGVRHHAYSIRETTLVVNWRFGLRSGSTPGPGR